MTINQTVSLTMNLFVLCSLTFCLLGFTLCGIHSIAHSDAESEGIPIQANGFGVVHFRSASSRAAQTSSEPRIVKTLAPHFSTSNQHPLPDAFPNARNRLATSPRIELKNDPVDLPRLADHFPAIMDNNTAVPPDTTGAVGPEHLMVTLNSEVSVQTRTGATLFKMIIEDFWLTHLYTEFVFDPKVIYDPYEKRFVFIAAADRNTPNSSLLIGVTETHDPTENWYIYQFDADTSNRVWLDRPSLGFNKNWIAVHANMYDMQTGEFVRSNIYAFAKQNLYYGFSEGKFFTSSVGSIIPAEHYDQSVNFLYFLTTWNGNIEGNGYLRMYRIVGQVGSERFVELDIFPSANMTWNYSSPDYLDFAPQLEASRAIDTGDDNIMNVVYRNQILWCAHTVFLPPRFPTRSAIQWWSMDTRGNVFQVGRIDDPSGRFMYAYPSIAVNRNNDALIGYNRFSREHYASAYYSFRAADDPINTMRSEVLLKGGEAPYVKVVNGRNRWGDYSATMVDPLNDTDFWTIQQFAAIPFSNGDDRWGTWWGFISYSPFSDVRHWFMHER